jgi:hypothetical protein
MDEIDRSEYIGKVVAVGIAYYDLHGTTIRQEQIHGSIIEINNTDGIVIETSPDGRKRVLPPDLSGLQKAPLGEFKHSSTGEVVIDPDFISFWRVDKKEIDGEIVNSYNKVKIEFPKDAIYK